MDRYVDPELRAAMPNEMLTDISDVPGARARLLALRAELPAVPVPEGVVRREISVASRDARRRIRCFTYLPQGRDLGDLPVVLIFHGGGFVMGDIDGDQSLPFQIVTRLGFAAVTVGYRLAPENPYPAAVDDGEDVLRWLRSGGLPGTDPERIAAAGASAGGCLAAAVVVRSLRTDVRLCGLALDIPVLDDRLQHPSNQFRGTPLWDLPASELSWGYYLSGLGRGEVPDDAAPARTEHFEGWPATYLSVSALDPMRDEGISFAQRLTDAGVPTELHLHPGTFHGSTSVFPGAAVSRRARDEFLEALGRMLA